MIRLVNIFILLFVCHCLNAKNTTFPTLEDLDKVVANQQIYTNARLRMLDSLKSDLRKADDLHKKICNRKRTICRLSVVCCRLGTPLCTEKTKSCTTLKRCRRIELLLSRCCIYVDKGWKL